MNDRETHTDRRAFLKLAGAIAATSALPGCQLESHPPDGQNAAVAGRESGFDRLVLDAIGEVALPSSLSPQARDAAIGAFVQWADDYEPVAEEMHGYGYADVRYLPADPAPAWRAQLAALDLLARRIKQQPFVALPVAERRDVLHIALRGEAGDRLPPPLEAKHIVVALVAHWASRPAAWDLAFGAQIAPGTCRVLGDANRKPLPIANVRT
jgi:Gluconate 2-dehydrogenase subunit 3